MLEEVVVLSRDNNVVVRKLLSAQRRATLWRALYWVVIIGASFVGYYALQPYLSSLGKSYTYINQVLDGLPK